MIYLLDTSVVSDFVKGEPGTVDRLLSLSPADVAAPVIVRFEVFYGLALSPARARRLRPKLEELFEAIRLLAFESDDADEAAHVRAELRRRGMPIGPYDVLIAGMARQRGLVLVTGNVEEFSRVEGLRWESWRRQPEVPR